jgi:antitoxin (DNA-binding transcriptional repressor) of toxin-antitoxin stability system
MFIGPCYNLNNGNAGTTVASAISVLQLKPGTNGPAEILRASMSQSGNTTSAQVAVALQRKSAAATVTIAVAGVNVAKLNPIAPTADASLGTSATGFTASAEGTPTDYPVKRGFNVLNGFEWLPTPEERVLVPQSGFLGLTFVTAPPSSVFYAELQFRELRGS